MSDCLICQRLQHIHDDPWVIKEFNHSYMVLGDHQYFEGYSVLLFKNHVRDMHQLPHKLQTEFFSEVMQAATAINQAFKPWKLNYSCYGNQVEHIHWHIFPRYQSDPDLRQHPWLNSDKFKIAEVNHEQRLKNMARIKEKLN